MELKDGILRRMGILWRMEDWDPAFRPDDWKEIVMKANDAITEHYIHDFRHYGARIAEERAMENSGDLRRLYCMMGIDLAVRSLDFQLLPFNAPAEVVYD